MTAEAPTAQNGERLLEINNLRKYFPIKQGLLRREVGNIRAVDDVSFYINEGRRLAWWARVDAARPRPRGAS